MPVNHPLPPHELKRQLWDKAIALSRTHHGPASHGQVAKLVIMLENALKEVIDHDYTKKRRSALVYLTTKDSASNLSKAGASAIIDYACVEERHIDGGGEPYLGRELLLCVRERIKQQGQLEMSL